MKPVVVATSDLADGFRLAGIPVYEVDDGPNAPAGQTRAIIEAVLARNDVGIVLVDERYMADFEQAFGGRELPMVASFPAEEVHRDETYIDELTRRYLGQKIYVEGS